MSTQEKAASLSCPQNPPRPALHAPPVWQPPTDTPMETMCFPAVIEAAAQPARMLRRASPCRASQQQTFGQGPVQCLSTSISVTDGTRRSGLPGSCSSRCTGHKLQAAPCSA